MRAAVIVPAYRAHSLVGAVVSELVSVWPEPDAVVVVDDGSDDGTAAAARDAGATDVLRHEHNEGKGAALRSGLGWALARGFDVAVTVDADGQHPPVEALRMHRSCSDPDALVIGVRDLVAAGAPRPSQLSNRFSNLVLSAFCARKFADTQCGLRRYPVGATLALGGQARGYGFEAEILIRATATDMPIVEIPVEVIYPPEDERVSHFHAVRDPARIVARVVRTTVSTRARWVAERLSARRSNGQAR